VGLLHHHEKAGHLLMVHVHRRLKVHAHRREMVVRLGDHRREVRSGMGVWLGLLHLRVCCLHGHRTD